MADKEYISTGKFKRINWVQIDPVSNDIFPVDEFMAPTLEFWDRLETECVSECCGIDAFGFWPEEIEKAVSDLNKKELIDNLQAMKNAVLSCHSPIIRARKLNHLFDRSVFIQLLDHIIGCLVKEVVE
jgi:hypothetical protein